MRILLPLFFILLLFSCSTQKEPLSKLIDNNLELAAKQYKLMDASLPDSLLPFSVNPDGTLKTSDSHWWTSGFYPGTLWYLYQYSSDKEIEKMAKNRLKAIEEEKYNDGDHDIGFKILCSFGNAWKATKDTSYMNVILTAAKTLTHRFNPAVGLIRSWGAIDDSTQYLVIVDNMMNLELLFWATQQTGDSSFYKIAVAHADQTLKNHYRDDGSSYHVLNYDQQNGEIINKKTAQGYSDESAWARGQAWGLYGYIVAYRETGQKRYLQHAQKIAGFILNHPHLPEDCVPYWDFDAPDIPNAKRDASAGAIMASAMIELSGFVDNSEKEACLNFAKTALRTLSSPEYRTGLGENNNYLLKHGVGHMPNNSEVDVPLCYADYYYVEALIRMKRLQEN